MKGVTYDSIKRHKKTGFHAFSEKHIFEKTKDGGRGEGGGGGVGGGVANC